MKSTAQSLTSATSWHRWFVFTVLFITLDNFSALASDTWTGNGSTANWSNIDNWSTGAVPVAGDDVIMPGGSKQTMNNANIAAVLNTLQFPVGAPSFTILIVKNSVTISGGGVINDSGVTQTLEVPADSANPVLNFGNSATAANAQIINDGGPLAGGFAGITRFNDTSSAFFATINNNAALVIGAPAGTTTFRNSSSAGGATITNFGAAVDSSDGGTTQFMNNSSAESATINNNAGTVSNARGGTTLFNDSSSAGNATINNNGSAIIGSGINHPERAGMTSFNPGSSAGSASIFNNGGTAANATGGSTFFQPGSTAENATIVNNGGATSAAFGGKTDFTGASIGASAGNATITNNGGTAGIATGGMTQFFGDSATAANAVISNNASTAATSGIGGETIFDFGATAGSATINNNGSAVFGSASQFEPEGIAFFHGSSGAGSAMIFNNGGTNSFAAGGQTIFDENSTAKNATITNNGGTTFFASGGQTIFRDSADASNATLIANAGTGGHGIVPGGFGGLIQFLGNSTGGTARVEVFGNGSLDISGHIAPGVTIGSIEGSGNVFLGANNLAVGNNNLSTNFSGVAQDGDSSGSGGTGGSLTKIGTGTLTLSGTNTYTGATAVNAGKLFVDGSIASSSGVAVAAGATLGGHGNVSSISGAGAIAPGNSPGILTATHLDPISGMSFVFELTQTGSPTYGNAAASGNDVLRLTDNTPFTMSLNSSNQITIDFSGASLAAGQLYRGGFFTNITDTATATSLVSGATFLYTGTGGFTVNFDGFVTELSAAFASGTVSNGTMLQFDISGEGNGGGPTVPDTAPTLALLLLSLSATFGLNSLLLRRSAAELNHAN
jgi:autotransporter-associated beta strand protein